MFSSKVVFNSLRPIDCSMPGFSVLHYLLEFAQTHVHSADDVIQPSYPLLSPSPPASVFPSIRVFSNELAHQVAQVLELQLQHQSFQKILRVDFHQDWLVWSSFCPSDSPEYFLAWQFKSINFLVLSLLYGSTLTSVHGYWKKPWLWLCGSLLAKWCLCFLIRFIVAFLPKSKRVLISCRQLSPAMTVKPKKIKSITVSTFSPSVCHEVMEPDAVILVFLMLSFKPAFHSPLSPSSRSS